MSTVTVGMFYGVLRAKNQVFVITRKTKLARGLLYKKHEYFLLNNNHRRCCSAARIVEYAGHSGIPGRRHQWQVLSRQLEIRLEREQPRGGTGIRDEQLYTVDKDAECKRLCRQHGEHVLHDRRRPEAPPI